MQSPNTKTEISCLQNQLEDLNKKIGDSFQQDLKFYEAKGLLHEIKFLKKKIEELREKNY
jgi:peptidoglycan hydrolase CwlO-like protein